MKTTRTWLAIAALVLSIGCSKETTTQTPEPSAGPAGKKNVATERLAADTSSATMPEDVLVVIALPTGLQLTSAIDAVAEVVPDVAKMAPMVMPQLTQAVSTMFPGLALDSNKPMYLLVLDPKKYGDKSLVAVGSITGKPKMGMDLIENGPLSVAGDDGAVAAAANYAHGLAVPTELVVTIPVSHIYASYRETAKQALQQLSAQMGGSTVLEDFYMGMFEGLATQSEHVELRLDKGTGRATLRTLIVPVPGTMLAKFAKAQTPHTFDAMERFGLAGTGILMSGKLVGGPARDALIDMSAGVIRLMGLPKAEGKIRAALVGMADNMTGEFAGAMTWAVKPGNPMPSMKGVVAYGTTSRTIKTHVDNMYKLMAGSHNIMGVKSKLSYKAKAGKIAGTAYGRYVQKMNMAGIKSEQRGLVAVPDDNRMLMVLGPNDKELKRQLKAALTGKTKGSWPKGAQAALAIAKSRQASALMYLDLAAFMKLTGANAGVTLPFTGMSWTADFRDGKVELDFDFLK